MQEKKNKKTSQKPYLQDNLVHQADQKTGFKAFLAKQNIIISFKRYMIDALGAMALGLFASLLIGTIINTLAMIFPDGSAWHDGLQKIGSFGSQAAGAAMAIAIGYALEAPPLVLFSLAGVGMAANTLGGAGGPMAVFFIAVPACELGKLVSKTTAVDIILTPFVTLVSGGGLALGIAPWLGKFANLIGSFVMSLTDQQPLLMGILVSVIMGLLLTLPISSAAIAASFGMVGLAGGAGLAGCCAQMVGFAVISYKENGLGGLLAQGLGTSMLQLPNIMRNPRILIPPTLAAAITGPIATVVFKLQMNGPAIASGMGTSGLVGPIGQVTGWFVPSEKALEYGATLLAPGPKEWLGLILVCIVLPAILSYLFSVILRKIGWIKENDLKIKLN